MKKTVSFMLAFTLVSVLLTGSACSSGGGQDDPAGGAFDESGFTGTTIKGVPDTLDMVGYGNLYNTYDYGEDGSVAMPAGTFTPLRASDTRQGLSAKVSIRREDGVYNVMSEAANTGALYVQTESIRHRFYVVGAGSERGYLVVSAAKPHGWDSASDYFERRYPVPLESYCTGAPHTLELSYLNGVYSVRFTSEDGKTFFKQIDKDTPFVANPDFPTDMIELFDEGERVLGLECMNVSARFSDASFKLGDKAAEEAFRIVRRKVTYENSTPSEGKVSVSNEDPVTGEQVVVTIAPEEGCYVSAFTVNGVNRKGELQKTEKEGVYSYELIGVQTDTVVRATFLRGTEVKHTVTGTYSYTSGVYDPATGRYTNEGDNLSVTAGIYEGTAAGGLYSIELPDGLFTLRLHSEKFPAAEKQVFVGGADTDGGNIAFDRLNFDREVVYNYDGSLTFSAQKTNRLIQNATAEEGFAVHYKVQGAPGGYFNTGGLYLENANGTYEYLFIYVSARGSASAVADVVLIESSRRWDNGPVYRTAYPYTNTLDEIDVTIIYYEAQFHVILDGIYACTIDRNSTLITTQGTLDEDFFKAKPRKIGLRNYDSAATFSDVSYGLGNEAALHMIEQKNVKINTEASGGTVALTNKTAPIQSDATIDLGTTFTATLTATSGNLYVESFTVNGEDSRYLLNGPFTVNGNRVWTCALTAAQGGMDIRAEFTDAAPATHKVTGTYSSESGETGAVGVKAGSYYSGTAEGGNFAIDLPDGTYILTFTDASGKSASKQVTVHGQGVNAGEAVFYDVGFENMDGVTEVENGYFIKGTIRNKPLKGNVVASDGFAVTYTVTATDGGFYKGGGFYMEKDGVIHSVFIFMNEASVQNKASIRFLQPDAGTNPNGSSRYYIDAADFTYPDISQSVKVTIAYYRQAFYIMLDDGYAHKFSAPTDMNGYAAEMDGRFFSAGYRTLGFRAMDSDVTFEDISYSLGDEAALAAIHTMHNFETVE